MAADSILAGYDFADLTAYIVLVYGASFLLYRGGRITVRAHRMVWNALLFLTFAASAASGVILILKINYGIVVAAPFNLLYWHVETGIAMTVISVFHILWHLDYYRSMFRRPAMARGRP